MKKPNLKKRNFIIGTVIIVIVVIIIIILVIKSERQKIDQVGYIKYGKGGSYLFCPNLKNYTDCYIIDSDNYNLDYFRQLDDNKSKVRVIGRLEWNYIGSNCDEPIQIRCDENKGYTKLIINRIEKLYD